MYITDLTHFLGEKGAIAPMPAPARRLAEFLGRVVAAASAPAAIDEPGRGECRCNKCKKGHHHRGDRTRRHHRMVLRELRPRRPDLQLATIVLGSVGATDGPLTRNPRNPTARRAILGTLRANHQNQADSDPR